MDTVDEDLDGDGDPRDVDTDGDGRANFLDPDDDGDGASTLDEDLNGDCDLTNDDANENGIPAYLDPAEPADQIDADGDGFVDPSGGGDDCDDSDPTVYPGAPEEYYDGVDADCAGDSDNDKDGDGFDSDHMDGDDCDDSDPDVNPDAKEDLSDVDRDCDGFTDPPGTFTTELGFACATTGGTGGWFLIGLALLVGRRRDG